MWGWSGRREEIGRLGSQEQAVLGLRAWGQEQAASCSEAGSRDKGRTKVVGTLGSLKHRVFAGFLAQFPEEGGGWSYECGPTEEACQSVVSCLRTQ